MGGLGRIWQASLIHYANTLDIRSVYFVAFCRLVRAIDDEYVKYCNERAKEEQEKSQEKTSKSKEK